MAGNIPKLVDKGFQNWIKANLALNIIKEGIEDAVLTEINTFHQDTLNDILSPEQILNNDLCKQCKNENILPCPTRGICIVKTGLCSFHYTQQKWYRPCPKHVCDRLREKIKQCHKYNFPSWKNTKAENWCQNPWELAKCYLPPNGYLGVSSIAETDINGIISVIMNHSAFRNKVDMSNCDQVREVSRRVRHSADICINDQDTNDFLDTLTAFLSCSSLFQGDVKAATSVQKISKLKMDSLTITTNDVTKVLQDVIHENTQRSLQAANIKLAERVREVKLDLDKLEEVAKESIKDIFTAKVSATGEIEGTRKAAIADVENISKTVINNVEVTKRTVIDDIEVTKRTTINDVEVTKRTAINDVGDARRTAITDVKDIRRTAIDDIETIAEQQKSDLYSDINKAKTNAVAEIEAMKQTSIETKYQCLKADFKSDLLTFNQEYHSTIPLSSVFEENDTPLQGFYVQPAMNSIEMQKTTFNCPAVEVRQPIRSLKDVFKGRNSKRCKNIYLTSEAGQGKTCFCKQLVLTWCHAHVTHKSEHQLSVHDIQVMKDFEYIFLISLRDSMVECDVDEMIARQIVPNLAQNLKYTPEFIQTLLYREKCLVLLDGLDEWSHPKRTVSTCTHAQDKLPYRKARTNCTILTTTRSWTLSIVKLKSSQIDSHIEIGNLDDDSSGKLIANAVRKILVNYSTENNVSNQIEQITAEIRSRSTRGFEMNPLTLTYMVCLLCDGNRLGQSQCELYAQIIDFLIRRGEKKTGEVIINDSAYIDTEIMPVPFRNCGRFKIKSFYKNLISIGRLACSALFHENREQSLVFGSTQVDNCLTLDEQKFSLSSGILVQSILPGRLTTRDSMFTFPHKTLQEFFAALYISSVPDLNYVKELVIKKCYDLETIIEMSNVFIFVSGLCPEKFNALAGHISNIANDDTLIIQFRNECRLFAANTLRKPVKDLQNMYITCVKECFDANGEYVFPQLQDIILDSDRNDLLREIILANINNVKSIWLSQCDSKEVANELIENLKLESTHSLECLRLFGPVTSGDVERLFFGSVHTMRQIMINSSIVKDGFAYPTYCIRSDTSIQLLQDMTMLTSLHLITVKMSHPMLQSLLTHLAQRTSMKRITLNNISCINHGESCPGFSMDLSQHYQLIYVGLNGLPLVHLDINTSKLETCFVGALKTSSAFSSFLTCLIHSTKLREFLCKLSGNENDLNTVMDTIPLLTNVKKLAISGTDIKDKVLKLSPDNTSIEQIYIGPNVTMTVSSLDQLIQHIEQLQQSVLVRLNNCTVRPLQEYQRIKNYLKSSDRFELVYDGEDEGMFGEKHNMFLFRTVK